MTGARHGFHHVGGVPHIDQVDVGSIVRRWPTPVLVYSASALRNNVAAVQDAFPDDTILQYSYKACYLPAVLRQLHAAGLDAEVCSAREYRLATAIGLPPERIVWNAVTFDDADLALAVEGGALWLGLNTLHDIARLNAAAGSSGRRLDVALRLHPAGVTSSYLEAGSRLGLDVTDGTAARAVDLVLDSANLRLVGVHSHTQVRRLDPDAHVRCLRSLIEFARSVHHATGYQVSQLGLGGGLNCRSELRRSGTDVSDFGDALGRVMRDECAPGARLVLEPGRFFVSDTAVGLSTVLSQTSARGNDWIMIDLGTQVLVPFEGRQFPVRTATPSDGTPSPVSIGDRLSSYSGVLATDVSLPPVEDGDLLVLTDAGAYTTSVAQRFMFGSPAVVMVDGSRAALVYAAESDADWVRGLLEVTDG